MLTRGLVLAHLMLLSLCTFALPLAASGSQFCLYWNTTKPWNNATTADGAQFTVVSPFNTSTFVDFFNYTASSANSGLERSDYSVGFLVRNALGDVGLGLIHDKASFAGDNTGGGVSVSFKAFGLSLPTDPFLVRDDPVETYVYELSTTVGYASWSFPGCCTDGMVVGPIIPGGESNVSVKYTEWTSSVDSSPSNGPPFSGKVGFYPGPGSLEGFVELALRDGTSFPEFVLSTAPCPFPSPPPPFPPPPPPPPPFESCVTLPTPSGSSIVCTPSSPPFPLGATCNLVCSPALTPLPPATTTATCLGPAWSTPALSPCVVPSNFSYILNDTFPSSIQVGAAFFQLVYVFDGTGALSSLTDTSALGASWSPPSAMGSALFTSLHPGIFNVTGFTPTTAAAHTLTLTVITDASPTTTLASFTTTTTPGPLASTQVTGVLANSETELEFGVPLAIAVRLTDAFGNARNPSLPPSVGGGDIVSVSFRRGTTATAVPTEVFPSGEVVAFFSTTQGGIYSIRVIVNDVDVTGSPFLVVVATRCSPGTRLTPDDLCAPCPEDTFSDVVNSPLCSACPANTRAPSSSSAISNCTCVPDTWLDVDVCVACPTRATCDGGLTPPRPRPGFIAGPDNNFVTCPRPAACTGLATCAPGYTGELCATCAPGYYSDVDGSCVKCPSQAAGSFAGIVIALVVVALLIALALALMLAKSASNADKVKSASRAEHMRAFRALVSPASLSMILVAFQVVGILAEAKFEWNSESQAALSLFTSFNVDLTHFASECALRSWHAKYALSLLLPTLGLVVIVLGVVIIKIVGTRFSVFVALEGVSVAVALDTVIFTVAPLVYLPLSRTTFTLFDCTTLPNSKLVIDSDPGVACFDSKWWSLLPLGGASLLLFVLGIPAYFGTRLFLARNSLFEPEMTSRLGSLYRLYRRAYYWGEVAALLKRLVIVVAGVFFTRHQLLQIGIIFGALLVGMVSVARAQPFYITMYNGIDLRLNACVLLILMLGVGSYTERASDASETFFIVAILISLCLLVLISCHALFLDVRHLLRTRDSIFYTATQRQGRLVSLITTELQDVEADVDLLRSAGIFITTLDDTINERRASRRPDSDAMDSIMLDNM